jgi:hypothetical protein
VSRRVVAESKHGVHGDQGTRSEKCLTSAYF